MDQYVGAWSLSPIACHSIGVLIEPPRNCKTVEELGAMEMKALSMHDVDRVLILTCVNISVLTSTSLSKMLFHLAPNLLGGVGAEKDSLVADCTRFGLSSDLGGESSGKRFMSPLRLQKKLAGEVCALRMCLLILLSIADMSELLILWLCTPQVTLHFLLL